eukprot:TRINITY_DN620_c0_g3_i3.p1 TRINITY_DN620_c0_g3~~TRINITY_DN620_c0_g3_i3.p1  ORF type:complete len:123 (+),score=15.83 TRINITY_DN620_c0_g3_i3:64-432(+)
MSQPTSFAKHIENVESRLNVLLSMSAKFLIEPNDDLLVGLYNEFKAFDQACDILYSHLDAYYQRLEVEKLKIDPTQVTPPSALGPALNTFERLKYVQANVERIRQILATPVASSGDRPISNS